MTTRDLTTACRLPPFAPREVVASVVREGVRSTSPLARIVFLSLFLLPVALVPASYGRQVTVPGIGSVWWADVLIAPLAAMLLAGRLAGILWARLARSTTRLVLLPFLALGSWQVTSILWNGRDWFMRRYSFLESALTMCALVGAVLLASGMDSAARRRFGRYTVILVGSIIAVYMMLSFVVPTWRPSSSWIDLTAPGLGFIRVFGPLANSTTLNFLLTPCLGFCVGAFLSRGPYRFWWGLAATFFVLAMIGTGSRGALICLAAFALTMTVALRLRALMLLLPLSIVLLTLVATFGIPERLRSFEDQARASTYAAAWRAVTSGPIPFTLGLGHGALYSRLHDESMRAQVGERRWYLFSERNEFGETLRSSHTALLRTWAESGMLGITFLLMTFLGAARRLFSSSRLDREGTRLLGKGLIAGCLGAVPYMALDEFFVGAPWIPFFWFLFLTLGLEMTGAAGVVETYGVYYSERGGRRHLRIPKPAS